MTARRATNWRMMRAVVIRFSFALRVSLSEGVDASSPTASRGGWFRLWRKLASYENDSGE